MPDYQEYHPQTTKRINQIENPAGYQGFTENPLEISQDIKANRRVETGIEWRLTGNLPRPFPCCEQMGDVDVKTFRILDLRLSDVLSYPQYPKADPQAANCQQA